MGRNPARVDSRTLQAPRVVAYVLLGLLAFSIFLIVAAPASLLATALERTGHDTIAIDAPTGTLWSGSGQLIARQMGSPPAPIGRVTWSVNPLWLVTGKIGVTVTITGGGTDIKGRLRVGYGSADIRDVKGAFPARFVPYFYAPAELLGPDGQIEISAESLNWSRKGAITGVAEVHWRDAASGLTSVRPLGDYRLSLEGQGGPAEMKLETLNGALRFSGRGTLDVAAGAFRLSGNASAQERAGELAALLNMIRPGPDSTQRPFNLEFSWRT